MTKDNWIKAFDEKFTLPVVMEADFTAGSGFVRPPRESINSFVKASDIKSFISQVEKDAIEKTNKRWRLRVKKLKEKEMVWNSQMTYGRGEVAIHNHGRQEALSDLLEDKK